MLLLKLQRRRLACELVGCFILLSTLKVDTVELELFEHHLLAGPLRDYLLHVGEKALAELLFEDEVVGRER